MKTLPFAGFKGAMALLAVFLTAHSALAQAPGNCSEISNDVSVAVGKDPSKVLMVVEDALVINEGCAGEIVKAAIVASKADPALANQIVQTAVSVAPKMTVAINEAASSVVPGMVAAAPVNPAEVVEPIVVSEKNPGKNPIVPVETVEEDFFIPTSIRGVYLIQPPASGPLPRRCDCNPVSPAVAIP